MRRGTLSLRYADVPIVSSRFVLAPRAVHAPRRAPEQSRSAGEKGKPDPGIASLNLCVCVRACVFSERRHGLDFFRELR